MILDIHNSDKIADIKGMFAANYPFLKIEFFHRPHFWEEISVMNDKIDDQLTIGDVRNHHNDSFVEIHYWQKTGTVERIFRDKAGLNIQVFRKHGDRWIQTAGTDEMTLEEQNNIGRMASEELMHGNNRKPEMGKFI